MQTRWGRGGPPTLKGGSKIGIASPPGVWRSGAEAGSSIVRPSIEAVERLQGFRAGRTSHVAREGERWKLVGNAVTVPVANWVGERLVNLDRQRTSRGGRFQLALNGRQPPRVWVDNPRWGR